MSKNPLVFLDISVNSATPKRITIELFADSVPKTAENFRQLCVGQEKGRSYKNTPFHRILKNSIAQGGDITHHNGTGGKSIYGSYFNDENFILKHDSRGIVSMANAGRNTNNSQFFFAFRPLHFLDGAHVVFGKITPDTLHILDDIEEVGVPNDSYRMKDSVIIVNCGEVQEK